MEEVALNRFKLSCTRHLTLCISTIFLAVITANAHAFNIVIVCWSSNNQTYLHLPKGKSSDSSELSLKYYEHRGWLYLAHPIGAAVGIFPFVFFLTTIGTRRSVFLYGTISIISTVMFPILQQFHTRFWCRFAQNFALGCSFPLIGRIAADWCTSAAHTRLCAILISYIEIAIILFYPIATAVCFKKLPNGFASDRNWPYVYYGLGCSTIVVLALFCIIYCDTTILTRSQNNFYENCRVIIPEFIRKYLDKKQAILRKKSSNHQHSWPPILQHYVEVKENNTKKFSIDHIPLRQIFLEFSIWMNGFILSASAFIYALLTLIGPVYFHELQGLGVKKSGIFSTFPFIVSFFVKISTGAFVDQCRCLPPEFRFVWTISITQSLMIFFLMVFGVFSVMTLPMSVIAFALLLSAAGSVQVLVARNTQVLSLHYSYISMGIVYLVNNIFSTILPTFIYFVMREDNVSQWTFLFFITAALLAGTTAIFIINAKSSPRKWAINGSGGCFEEQESTEFHIPQINITHQNCCTNTTTNKETVYNILQETAVGTFRGLQNPALVLNAVDLTSSNVINIKCPNFNDSTASPDNDNEIITMKIDDEQQQQQPCTLIIKPETIHVMEQSLFSPTSKNVAKQNFVQHNSPSCLSTSLSSTTLMPQAFNAISSTSYTNVKPFSSFYSISAPDSNYFMDGKQFTNDQSSKIQKYQKPYLHKKLSTSLAHNIFH